jgi:hypothetical protein
MHRKIKVKEITDDKLLSKYDLIICSGGFEERVFGIKNFLKSMKTENLVIFEYIKQNTEIDKLNSENCDKLIEFLIPICENFYSIKNDPDDSTLAIDTFAKMGFEENKANSKNKRIDVLFDISGCNEFLIHTLILHLLKKATSLELKLNLHIIYTKPTHYNHEKMIEPYIRKVAKLSSGIINPLKQECLLLFIGFEYFRSLALIEYYSPAKVIILVNQESSIEKEKLSAQKALELHKDLIESDSSNLENIAFYKLSLILKKLGKIIEKYSEFNLILGCFGSKIQSIAASILSLSHEDLIISTVRPHNYYPKNYSCGIGVSLIYELQF